MRVRLALLIALFSAPSIATAGFNENTFGGLRARAIGPAVMGGRIAAIDAVATDQVTVYVGASGGGLWKSTDAGVNFEPVFDDYIQSIGAVRVDPSNPRTVWVGTGEPWTRNSVGLGKGIYKTTDGSENWKLMGLENTERIGAIRIDPTDGKTVYVAALGHLWNANEERGVYKTTDGGDTWKRILYVDENTGCADLDIDPQNPAVIYAAMWQFRRSPDFFNSGGPGSGLYRSTDGGGTWTKLTEGLPEGELGRISVAVAPSRPSTVYAVVECDETALYRSDDLGGTWRKLSTASNVQMRPFYFGELLVDPTDFRRVYKPGFTLSVSTDGGESFGSMFSGGFGGGGVHPDHHALWINPRNPHELFLGTDGGLYVSQDRGAHWRYARRLPIAQFYHVSTDNAWPYHVYGGLQDNGSWMGPSRAPGGIRNRDWTNIGFGDGFWAFPDPRDANTLYVEYQGGKISRLDRRLGEMKSITPYAEGDQEKLRFNWNAPVHLSANHPGTIYLGSQYLHRSRDRGESWETLSPDLTTDDPARQRQEHSGGLTIDNTTAENNTTIYSISESPVDDEVIWVGTDDGNVQVTRDGGGSWRNVVPRIPGVPKGTWVSCVHASPHDGAVAFVALDGHRTGDMTPYLFRTADYGRTWTPLVDDAVKGYVHVVVQDPVNPDLLFLGTEFGLYVTLDGGGTWARFKQNLPPVAVRDIVIQGRENDVVLATHGRGIYIIDDITPLRALTPEIMETTVSLLPSRPSPMVIEASTQEFNADDEFVGKNPSEAASITYFLKKRHLFGDLKVEVFDAEGKLLRTLPGKKRPGINRVAWPMRLKAPKVPPANTLIPAFQGPRVPEGSYRVRLTKGKQVLEGTVDLVPDPRTPHGKEERRLQQETSLRLYGMLADLTFVVESLVDLRDQARAEAANAPKSPARKLRAFAKRVEAMRTDLLVVSKAGPFAGKEKLRERLGDLYGAVVGYDGRPTESQMKRLEVLAGQLNEAQKNFARLREKELASLNRSLSKAGLDPLTPPDRTAWDERSEGSSPAGMTGKRFMRRLDWILAGLRTVL